MREEYDIRGGVRGKYYERYKVIAAEPEKAVNGAGTIERDISTQACQTVAPTSHRRVRPPA